MNIYKLKLNETVELEAMQTKALADQSSEEMTQLLLKEAILHKNSEEGKIVYNQLLLESKGYIKNITSSLS